MKKIIPGLLISLFLLSAISVLGAEFEVKHECKVYKDFNLPPGCFKSYDLNAQKLESVSEDTIYGPPGSTNGATCWPAICLMSTIYKITDWVFFFVFALSVVFVIMGAVYYLTSSGETEKITKGKNFILYAVIGLVIAVFARAIPEIVKFIIF